jgi:hypothetical protein
MTHKLKHSGHKGVTKKVYGSKPMLGGATLGPVTTGPVTTGQVTAGPGPSEIFISQYNYTNSYIDFMIKTLWLCLSNIPINSTEPSKITEHYNKLLSYIKTINVAINTQPLNDIISVHCKNEIAKIYKLLNSSELIKQLIYPTNNQSIYEYMASMYKWIAGNDNIKKCYDLIINTIYNLESLNTTVDWGEYIDDNALFNLTIKHINQIEDGFKENKQFIKQPIIDHWYSTIDMYKEHQFLLIKPHDTLHFMLDISTKLLEIYNNYNPPLFNINKIIKDELIKLCNKYYNYVEIFKLINNEQGLWHDLYYNWNGDKFILELPKPLPIESKTLRKQYDIESKPPQSPYHATAYVSPNVSPEQPTKVDKISMKYFNWSEYIKFLLEQKRLVKINWSIRSKSRKNEEVIRELPPEDKVLAKDKYVPPQIPLQNTPTPAENFKNFYGLNKLPENKYSKLFDICMYKLNPYIVMGQGNESSINEIGFQVYHNKVQYNSKPIFPEYKYVQLRRINKSQQIVYNYQDNYVNKYYMNSAKTIPIESVTTKNVTPVPASATPVPASATPVPASATPVPASATPVPASATPASATPASVTPASATPASATPASATILETIFTQKQIYNILFPPSTSMPDTDDPFTADKIKLLFEKHGGVIIDVLLYIIYLITESYKASVNDLNNYQKHKVILFNLHKFILDYLSTTVYIYTLNDPEENDININKIDYVQADITIHNNKTIKFISQDKSSDIIKINDIDITNLPNDEYNDLITKIKTISYKELNVQPAPPGGIYHNKYPEENTIFVIINKI